MAEKNKPQQRTSSYLALEEIKKEVVCLHDLHKMDLIMELVDDLAPIHRKEVIARIASRANR